MGRSVRRAVALAGVALATLGLVEFGTVAAVELGVLRGVRPPYRADAYWWGGHPVFGVWRHSNAEHQAQSACFRTTYRTNSVGMRDIEREQQGSGPRVVVLGDSYMAGWGVDSTERLSDRLERETGIPHLNFAMAHFAPYQEYLVYRELAKGYEHDAVILGLMPANDFRGLDIELSRRLADYEFRYRPYLVGEAPEFEHFNYREPWATRLLRRYSYFGNALLRLRAPVGRGVLQATDEELDALGPEARRAPSWFYDFQERHLQLLEAVFERLAAETQGKRVAVVLIPAPWEFPRYALSGPAPLAEALRPIVTRLGFEVVDLLPLMAAHERDSRRYFFRCDFHWSPYAHAVAARLLREELKGDVYPSD